MSAWQKAAALGLAAATTLTGASLLREREQGSAPWTPGELVTTKSGGPNPDGTWTVTATRESGESVTAPCDPPRTGTYRPGHPLFLRPEPGWSVLPRWRLTDDVPPHDPRDRPRGGRSP